MQGNLITFLQEDPVRNSQRIWIDYLPNDPFCQQSAKKDRNYAIAKNMRCYDCQLEDDSSSGLNRQCYHGTSLLCAVGSNTIGLDKHTNTIVSTVMLEDIIPNHVVPLERVFRCKDRITVLQPHVNEKNVSFETVYEQLQGIINATSQVKFCFGNITLNTLLLGDNVVIDKPFGCSFSLGNPELQATKGINAVLNPKTEYRIGSMDKCTNLVCDEFTIERYPTGNRRYIRPMINGTLFNYSEYTKILDFYRLICAATIKCKAYDVYLFRSMFLTSELPRIIKKLKTVEEYLSKHEENVDTYDMINCLYDKDGAFALRCDL